MKKSDMIIGVGLVILGILFLSENFGYIEFDFQDVWPVFVLLAGAGFWIGYYQDRKKIMRTLCKKAGVKYFRFHLLKLGN